MSIHTTAKYIIRAYGLTMYFASILQAGLWDQRWWNCGYVVCVWDWVPWYPWSIVFSGIPLGLLIFIFSDFLAEDYT